MLARQSSNNPIRYALWQLFGPLVHRLIGHANSSRSSSRRSTEQFYGF